MPIVKTAVGLASCAFAVVSIAYAEKPPFALSAPSFITQIETSTTPPRATPVYPLKASSNNRYLVDQNNAPFLMVGDAPQTLIANLSEMDADRYMANRARYGINTLWINLLCNYSDGCNKDATTFDGIPPFTVVGDISTPNPAYFQRANDMINIAAAHGMVVLLDPIETSSWLDVLRANGTAKAFEYGQWLGTRYNTFSNIIWLHGNDFQTWKNATDDALVQAVARGIRSRDPVHIHTVELNYMTSGSMDDPTWAPLIELDAVDTAFPTYAQVLNEYNRSDFKPVFLVEANYEFEHNKDTDGGSTQNLRRQGYWTMLSGGTGQIYGSRYSWRLENGWQTNLDTPGAVELGYMKDLFMSRKWYDLIPDQNHTIVTAGYDGLAGYIGKLWVNFGDRLGLRRLFAYVKRVTGLGSITTNAYAPAARTSDGTLLIVYMPTIRKITVDMSALAGPTTGRWYDPTSGRYTEVAGSAFANSGKRLFSPPGTNQAGDGDWVLVLETSRPPQLPN
jgi:Protein of unknown function (DUF4038)/Putative collagen-binding domain of a collagenase